MQDTIFEKAGKGENIKNLTLKTGIPALGDWLDIEGGWEREAGSDDVSCSLRLLMMTL